MKKQCEFFLFKKTASDILGNFNFAAIFSSNFDSLLKDGINKEIISMSTSNYKDNDILFSKYFKEKSNCPQKTPSNLIKIAWH